MDGKKVALVTGANKGIGFEISRQLGRHGFTVVLAARDQKKVADAAARLQGEGLDATASSSMSPSRPAPKPPPAGWTSGAGGSTCW